jgi:hypothetical protein
MTTRTLDIRHTRQCLTDIYVCGSCFHLTTNGEHVPPPDVYEKDGRYTNRFGQEVVPFSQILL